MRPFHPPGGAGNSFFVYTVDSGSHPLHGTHEYVLNLERFSLLSGYWSLWVFEVAARKLFIEPRGLTTVNSNRLPALKADGEGRVLLYLQRERPVAAKAANWLPVPRGGFFLELHIKGSLREDAGTPEFPLLLRTK